MKFRKQEKYFLWGQWKEVLFNVLFGYDCVYWMFEESLVKKFKLCFISEKNLFNYFELHRKWTGGLVFAFRWLVKMFVPNNQSLNEFFIDLSDCKQKIVIQPYKL